MDKWKMGLTGDDSKVTCNRIKSSTFDFELDKMIRKLQALYRMKIIVTHLHYAFHPILLKYLAVFMFHFFYSRQWVKTCPYNNKWKWIFSTTCYPWGLDKMMRLGSVPLSDYIHILSWPKVLFYLFTLCSEHYGSVDRYGISYASFVIQWSVIAILKHA